MISLELLFEDGNTSSVPKKYKKRIARKCKIFKGFEQELPDFSYPRVGEDKFEEDLGEVRRCVKNPSLSKKFLKLSDRDSEEVFKKFLKDEDIDWSSLDDVFKEFDGIMLRQKFKYNRRRPFEHFEDRGENIETETAHSPSFPSGHTAFAYLICGYFSDMFPEKSMQLQTIAEMIAQSRIENGVHFPTDIESGRFLGERAADFILKNNLVNESFITRENQKTFVKFLRERAQSLRSSFAREKALRFFVDDMAYFINESTNESIDDCHIASLSFIEGYPVSECTSNTQIQQMFEGMIHIFFKDQETFYDFSKLNSVLESSSEIRNTEMTTLSGIAYAPTNRIVELAPKVCRIKEKPFLKIATLSWIAPFKKGNKKITNLVFLKETNFNFDITNQIVTDELDFMLENFYADNKMEKILS